MNKHYGCLAFLDTETTGLYPDQGHRVIEFSVSITTPWPEMTVLEEFHTKIKPSAEDLKLASPKALEVNGYAANAHLWETAPASTPQLWAHIRDLLRGTILVCQNYPFDSGMLKAEMLRHYIIPVLDGEPWQRRFVETYSFGHVASVMNNVRDARGNLTWGLAAIYKALGGPDLPEHSAKPDVLRAMYLYKHFMVHYAAGQEALKNSPAAVPAAEPVQVAQSV